MTSSFLIAVMCAAVSVLASVSANPNRGQRPCEEGQYRCVRGDQHCIPIEWVCDGDGDCEGGDDETQDCSNRSACDEGFFHCNSGRCIPDTWVCDKDGDCDDSSDEQGCTYSPDTTPRPQSQHRHRNLDGRRGSRTRSGQRGNQWRGHNVTSSHHQESGQIESNRDFTKRDLRPLNKK